ncbi:MAG: DUF882 domain-containing protein [Thermodesulfovibrionales bacterium]|nr:DUF882 domain-containing protein [Thermodesulfovibrionales bacterium]
MISRRNFLRSIFAAAAAYPFRKVFASPKDKRFLDLYNVHTGERLNTRYYESGIYSSDAINQIHYLLRCHYTDEVMPVDIRLLDLLCDIKDVFGKDKEVHIISGYRSYAYNEYLRSLGRKVAKDSLHLCGLAVDFSIPGVSSSELSSVARSFSAGGVGKYPEFVHIDLGRIRYW